VPATESREVALIDARGRLVTHPLYAQMRTIADVRVFMKHHVFAVWDFFSLLKRLQAEVTCVAVPWHPRPFAQHGRFIMEIVVSEETDEDVGGGFISHFELYRRAMEELDADAGPITGYLDRVRQGHDPIDALADPAIPRTVQQFVTHTLTIALHARPHEVAASFCHGRENLLPDALTPLRDQLRDMLLQAPTFAHYLDRHITLDHDEHGPRAVQLLASLCGQDPELILEAEASGIAAIEARITLWDGILEELQAA
jgi:hypothetical protein